LSNLKLIIKIENEIKSTQKKKGIVEDEQNGDIKIDSNKNSNFFNEVA